MSDFDHMMAEAIIAYNRMQGSIGKQDMARNRVELAEAMAGEGREAEFTSRLVVHFEDQGQDFTRWIVEDGVVIESHPFQTRIWMGTLVREAVVGKKPKITLMPDGLNTELKYRVTRLERRR